MADLILDRTAAARAEFFLKQGSLIEELWRQGQSPEALLVTCSDSRVTPEQLLGTPPGELFMLRNVGNIIPPYAQTEIGIASVLEFAILHLHVPHLIVCGHTDCGGIRLLEDMPDVSRQPGLARWLSLARPAQWEIDFLENDIPPEERHRAIVERNVIHQLGNLRSYPFIQRALQDNELQLHGWVYYLERQEVGYWDEPRQRFVSG